MVADSITDEQIIGAFKGKYATVAEIPADVVKNKLIDKWDKFKFFLNNQGGN